MAKISLGNSLHKTTKLDELIKRQYPISWTTACCLFSLTCNKQVAGVMAKGLGRNKLVADMCAEHVFAS